MNTTIQNSFINFTQYPPLNICLNEVLLKFEVYGVVNNMCNVWKSKFNTNSESPKAKVDAKIVVFLFCGNRQDLNVLSMSITRCPNK